MHERREQRDPRAAAGEPHAVEVLRAGAGVGERLGEEVDDPPQRRAQDLGELAPRQPRRREPPGQRHRGLLGVGELLLRGAHVVEQHLTVPPVAEGRGGDDLADTVGVAPRSQIITRRVLGGRLVRERRQQVTQQQLVGVVAPEAVVASPREQPGATAAPGVGREHGRVGPARPEVEHRDGPGSRATLVLRAHPRGVRGGRDGLREQGELGGEPGPGPPQHLAAPRVPAGRVGEDEVARPVPAQQRARPLERPGEDGTPRLRDPDHPGAEQEVGIVDPQAWRRLVARGIGRGQPPGGGPDGERRAVGGGEHGGEVERHLGGLDGVRGRAPGRGVIARVGRHVHGRGHRRHPEVDRDRGALAHGSASGAGTEAADR